MKKLSSFYQMSLMYKLIRNIEIIQLHKFEILYAIQLYFAVKSQRGSTSACPV